MSKTGMISGDGEVLGVLGMLRGGTSKIERFISIWFAANTVTSTAKKLYRSYKARFEYKITINSDDSMYPDVHQWLIENMPVVSQRAVMVESVDTYMPTLDENVVTGLRYLFDGKQTQDVMVEGHKISVSVSDDKPAEGVGKYRPKASVVLVCDGLDARNAVMRLLAQITGERQAGKRVPRLYIASRWGDWSRRDDLTMRALDTVVLRAGVKETLVHDFETFRNNELDFIRLGIPYHRGYLFHGPSGTGKTSIAKALASHFGMDVYYMPLSDLETDNSLLTMVSRVPAGSMLLLEDIDVAHAVKDREDGKAGATLSGMLNALDGVATPHGLVVVMTTNNREALDEAIVRPGRVDMEMLIDYVDNDQLTRLFETFTDTSPLWPLYMGASKIDAATVIGEILKNLGAPKKAINAVEALR